MYTVSSYYTARLIAEFPFYIIVPTLYCNIYYWGLGLSTEHWYTYPVHNLILCEMFACASSYSFFAAALLPNKQFMLLAMTCINLPLFLLGGFVISSHSIPWYMGPLAYISYYKWGYQAMMINEYEDLDIACIKDTNPITRCDPLGDLDSPENRTESMLALLGITIVNNFAGFLIMHLLARRMT